MRGEEVFENLKRTDFFDLSLAGEEEKRQIFLSVWAKCSEQLKRDYNREGLGRSSDDVGFGYLVEEFARHSSRIGHNTASGEHIAELLLSFLRNGDQFGAVGLRGRLHNPDFLEVQITGRRVVVAGITEVKASAEALRKKLDSQIANQEANLRKLISAIENKKEIGNAPSFFKKRKIVTAEKLAKKVVVPLGEGDKVRALLPVGWECVELEFSYQELVFIARSIWPGFENRISRQAVISEGYLARFEREFLNPLLKFSKQRLEDVFFDSKIKTIPAREILILISCLRKIPLLDKDINWTEGYLKRNEFYGLFPVYPGQPQDLTKSEEELFKKLMKWYLDLRLVPDKGHATEHVLFFLCNLSHFSKILSRALKNDEESSVRINEMDNFDLVTFLG